MNQSSWHDINEPGVFVKKNTGTPASSRVDETPENASPADEPEVRLSNPVFIKGSDGFAFNKKCFLQVDVEFLKETTRKKVTFDLFVISDGEEENLNCTTEAFEDKGIAKAEVTLYYGDAYGKKLDTDPAATCKYIFRAHHSKGEKDVESDPLEMPATLTIAVDFVEIADVHFHHNCALPCLDEEGKLIAALLSAFTYAKEHGDRELIVEGHADRSGDAKYNLQISKRRAEAIKALLDNDADIWSGVVKSDGKDQKLETEDYQQTLKALAVKYGWPCDPGAVDNQRGPKTESAVKSFQTEYNTRFPANEQLTKDGSVGPKTWKAIFFTLRDLLDQALKSASLDPAPTLTYGYPDGNGIYPCGESSPVTDLETSEDDRRVELVFYAKDDWSPAVPPDPGRTVETKKDPVSGKDWGKTPVEIGPPSGGVVTLKVVQPEKTPHKQFVNLAQDPVDQGPELKISVEVTGCADETAVSWQATAGDKNSKRNDPVAGLVDPDTKKVVAFKDKKSVVTTKVKGGKSECTLCCGLAGGDTFTVDVSCSGKSASVSIENWRRLWYQRTYHQDATIPAMATPEKQLKEVFIEFIGEPDVKFTTGTAGSVIVGNHNASGYHALLNTKHPGQCVNVIFCDKQFDGIDGKGNNLFVKKDETLTVNKKAVTVSEKRVKIFSPPLQKNAAFLISGSWNNANAKKSGLLTDDISAVTDNVGYVRYVDQESVEVTLPKNAVPTSDNPVVAKLTITAASGPWGGDGGTPPHNLIVINANDTVHSQCVMHELGHLMNMVPLKGYYTCPPNFVLADHTLAYEKMGGSGSHCHYKHDKTKSTADTYVDGRCIMFHQLNAACELIFCPDCSPFVRAQALAKFGDLRE